MDKKFYDELIEAINYSLMLLDTYKKDGFHKGPHCQNSCHPHLNNPNGEKGDNHGTIQCRTQTGYTKQTFIT